jgi:alpha-galactosidase
MADFRANAAVLASLRQYSWQYAMLDAGWYEDDPANAQRSGRHYQLDGNGRLIAAVNRFPSAADGEGFKRLADWLHTRGLKLGLSSGRHIACDRRNHRQLAPSEQVEIVLPKHGSAVYCMQ